MQTFHNCADLQRRDVKIHDGDVKSQELIFKKIYHLPGLPAAGQTLN